MEEIINEAIKVKYAIVIDKNGNNLGSIAVSYARQLAAVDKLDLVMVKQPQNGKGAVVKIMDYHKAQYEKKKHAKKANEIVVKEIQFNVEAASRDIEICANKFLKWSKKGKVRSKVRIKMHGRWTNKPELAMEKWQIFADYLNCPNWIVKQPVVEGRDVIAYIQNF